MTLYFTIVTIVVHSSLNCEVQTGAGDYDSHVTGLVLNQRARDVSAAQT